MDRRRGWVEDQLGSAVTLHEAGHPDGEAEVWRVAERGHTVAYLKAHHTLDKWRRERLVLERLAASPCPVPVPPLVSAELEAGWLLLGALPGRPASELEWTTAQRRSLHEQAGRLRRCLDAIEVDDADPLALPEALTRRLRAWSSRARAYVAPAVLAQIERAFDPSIFTAIPRRWCHRDLTPSNWIVEPTAAEPRLGVIDFGQARPDAWLVDAVKLWCGPWHDEPALADAFWAGYGRMPDEREQAALRQLVLMHGLATAVWAGRHAHAELSAHGRLVLERALAGATAGRSA